jgi:hypothetical protein
VHVRSGFDGSESLGDRLRDPSIVLRMALVSPNRYARRWTGPHPRIRAPDARPIRVIRESVTDEPQIGQSS